MTATDFAAKCGFSRNYWFVRARFDAPLTVSDCERIAKTCGMTLRQLFANALAEQEEKNPDGTWYQVNLTDFTESGETEREITNLSTNDSNKYPGWNLSTDDATFETSITDTMIHQKGDNPTWMLALTVDGEELAHCPASGDADLE